MSSNKLLFQQTDELYRIPGFEEYATTKGKIYSFKRGKYLQEYFNKKYYACVNLCQDGQTKTMLVHRLVWMAYHQKDVPEGLEIDHIDKNPLNNTIENLRTVTREENTWVSFKFLDDEAEENWT